jgi:ATP-dependent protease ClpP protease subunit
VGANAADWKLVQTEDNNQPDIVFMEGDIEVSDIAYFENVGFIADKIVFNGSRGGDLDATIKMGRVISEFNIDTEIAPDTVCLSGCAMMFMAGNKRAMSTTGEIGFHSPWADKKFYLGYCGIDKTDHENMVELDILSLDPSQIESCIESWIENQHNTQFSVMKYYAENTDADLKMATQATKERGSKLWKPSVRELYYYRIIKE